MTLCRCADVRPLWTRTARRADVHLCQPGSANTVGVFAAYRLIRSGGFGDRPVDPGHQAAKPLTDFFDRVLRTGVFEFGVVRPPGFVLGHPFTGEAAVLDLTE